MQKRDFKRRETGKKKSLSVAPSHDEAKSLPRPIRPTFPFFPHPPCHCPLFSPPPHLPSPQLLSHPTPTWLQPCWPLASSGFRAFAFAVPSTWNVLPANTQLILPSPGLYFLRLPSAVSAHPSLVTVFSFSKHPLYDTSFRFCSLDSSDA